VEWNGTYGSKRHHAGFISLSLTAKSTWGGGYLYEGTFGYVIVFFCHFSLPFARSFSDSTFRGLLAILEIFLGVCHQSLGGRNPLTLTKKLL
jgi:nitrate/nitrite transporter NarK